MAKQLQATEDYNAALSQCGTINYTGSNYLYTGIDITVTQVKNALNESTTAIGALCTSTKINKWAQFKSGHWGPLTDYTTGVYSWVNSTDGYRLGDFMGYNPNAMPPVYFSPALPASVNVEMFDTYTQAVTLARGESAPAAPTAKKTQVNLKSTFLGTTTNRYISVPVGGTVSQNITIAPTYSTTLQIAPTYYAIVGSEKDDIAVIEDGIKNIAVNCINPLFSGTITDIPDQTGGNTLSVTLNWSLTRTTTITKDIYARVLITGSGIQTNSIPLNQLSFTSNETKTGKLLNNAIVSTNNATTTVTISLQVSNTYEFTNLFTVNYSSFVWTNPGLVI